MGGRRGLHGGRGAVIRSSNLGAPTVSVPLANPANYFDYSFRIRTQGVPFVDRATPQAIPSAMIRSGCSSPTV